jgi:hypothetical protein
VAEPYSRFSAKKREQPKKEESPFEVEPIEKIEGKTSILHDVNNPREGSNNLFETEVVEGVAGELPEVYVNEPPELETENLTELKREMDGIGTRVGALEHNMELTSQIIERLRLLLADCRNKDSVNRESFNLSGELVSSVDRIMQSAYFLDEEISRLFLEFKNIGNIKRLRFSIGAELKRLLSFRLKIDPIRSDESKSSRVPLAVLQKMRSIIAANGEIEDYMDPRQHLLPEDIRNVDDETLAGFINPNEIDKYKNDSRYRSTMIRKIRKLFSLSDPANIKAGELKEFIVLASEIVEVSSQICTSIDNSDLFPRKTEEQIQDQIKHFQGQKGADDASASTTPTRIILVDERKKMDEGIKAA